MKLKQIKFLTNRQNLLSILFAIFVIFIFNISFNETKKLEGLSGNFLILNKLEPYNYFRTQNVTKVLEDNTFHAVQRMIEKRVHLLSLKSCKFKKKSDLVTKIVLVLENNLGKTAVRYVISPVEDVLKCKESISETIAIKLNTLIENELEKYNNELLYIELLENNELKKYNDELVKIELLEKNELLKIELLKNNELKKYNDELVKIELLEKNELKKYNKELLKIKAIEKNIDKLLDIKGNPEKLTILQKFQIDERSFELKNRKNRLNDMIEALSDEKDTVFLDERLFDLRNRKNRLNDKIEILSDKENSAFLDEKLFELKHKKYLEKTNNVIEILSDEKDTVFLDERLFDLKNRKNRLNNMIEILSDKENTAFLDEKFFKLKNQKIRLNNVIEILSDKRNIVFDEYSNKLEDRSISYRFIGNILIITMLMFVYLLILFMKNEKIMKDEKII